MNPIYSVVQDEEVFELLFYYYSLLEALIYEYSIYDQSLEIETKSLKTFTDMRSNVDVGKYRDIIFFEMI